MTTATQAPELTEREVKLFKTKLEAFALTLTPKEQRVLQDVLAQSRIFIDVPAEDDDDFRWWAF